MHPTTLILGVSLNPTRHSYRTVAALVEDGYPVVAIGSRAGQISGVTVHTDWPEKLKVHTVSLYLTPERQEPFIELLLAMKPQRIIFNKKTFNEKLRDLALARGIQVLEDCTLVMLVKGTYWGD